MSKHAKIRTALVVGSNGIVGRNLVELLGRAGDIDITVLARSHDSAAAGVRTIAVDLENAHASREALKALDQADAIFYAALAVRPTPDEQVAPNLALLQNSVGPILERSDGTHVCVVQGTKWYGSHRGPYKTPAQETDPRDSVHNFYHAQHDWLTRAVDGGANSWSTARPHFIGGFNIGNPNNLVMAIGVYAALQQAAGEPLHFPGTQRCFETLSTMTNAGLLARSMVWMASSPQCQSQDFNITNGDYFRWSNLWPRIAAAFGMEMGEVRTTTLAETMPAQKAVWQRIAAERGLRDGPFEKLVSWSWADFMFRIGWDDMSDSTKSRQYGFAEWINTESDILSLLQTYRDNSVLP